MQRSNNDVGGRVLEMSEAEFMVRGEGYIHGIDDLRRVALRVDDSGTPISVQDVATVQIDPDIRRGLAELNSDGEVVGGIVAVYRIWRGWGAVPRQRRLHSGEFGACS